MRKVTKYLRNDIHILLGPPPTEIAKPNQYKDNVTWLNQAQNGIQLFCLGTDSVGCLQIWYLARLTPISDLGIIIFHPLTLWNDHGHFSPKDYEFGIADSKWQVVKDFLFEL